MPKKLCIIINTPPGATSYRTQRFRDIFARLHRELETSHPFEYDIVPFYRIGDKDVPVIDGYDAYVLSGSAANLSEKGIPELYGKEVELLSTTRKPVLGICFGHQLMGFTHGFPVGKMEDRKIESQDAEIMLIFPRGFPLTRKQCIKVQVFHEEEIKYKKEFENTFDLLSSSEHCKVHAIKHKHLPQFGVQFHPETSDKASVQAKMDGEDILRTFVQFAVDYGA